MPNIGKDDHPKLWSLIFVLIIALTFCCFVMGQGLNSGTSVFLAGQGYGASLAGVLALVFSIAAALARLFVGPVIDNGKCSLVIIAGIAILIAGTALSAVVQGIPSSQSAVCCKAWALAQQQQQPRPPQQASYRKNGSAKALDTTASDSYRHEHRPAFALYLVGTIPQRTSMSPCPGWVCRACNRPQRTL